MTEFSVDYNRLALEHPCGAACLEKLDKQMEKYRDHDGALVTALAILVFIILLIAVLDLVMTYAINKAWNYYQIANIVLAIIAIVILFYLMSSETNRIGKFNETIGLNRDGTQ